jgi:hypothetical protein
MQLLEPDGNNYEIPIEIHRSIKALAADAAHANALDFIINILGCRHRFSFVVGVPNADETMLWFEGRRYVGEMLARLIERPIETQAEKKPPARTMTERARRRTRPKPRQG